MKYTFNFTQQIITGVVTFLTVIVITQIFDHEIKWALAIAAGIAAFITYGFFKKTC